ncbi:Smr/MutS family protein [Thermodesulfobacterium hydrogeniphilum]|uniref:Smr/MutS family protein n=1 Tax=Thermodesulfobacterium hydrogeniphilum TaxID=161156 RepID=UPI0006895438|nr:Smr/MutS family protein [Thermodesulfobacterium hydrogeniphilum]
MYRPFEKLRGYLSIPLNSFKKKEFGFSEKPRVCKERDWLEVIEKSQPLKEKNFFWRFTPKKAFWQKRKDWPPEKIEVKVWLTSEYIEGKASGISRQIIKNLREGKFSVQRTLNLRGMFVDEAKFAFEEFMKRAILNGDKCVLIIHGRGLSSKKEPVLKNKVKEWLEKGPFRKYILAYCSARPCDGGMGATYVLLSSKPIKR